MCVNENRYLGICSVESGLCEMDTVQFDDGSQEFITIFHVDLLCY